MSWTIVCKTGEIIFDVTRPGDKTSFNDIGNMDVFFVGLSSDYNA